MTPASSRSVIRSARWPCPRSTSCGIGRPILPGLTHQISPGFRCFSILNGVVVGLCNMPQSVHSTVISFRNAWFSRVSAPHKPPFSTSQISHSLPIWCVSPADSATCFGVYYSAKHQCLISHGELEIARLKLSGEVAWSSAARISSRGLLNCIPTTSKQSTSIERSIAWTSRPDIR